MLDLTAEEVLFSHLYLKYKMYVLNIKTRHVAELHRDVVLVIPQSIVWCDSVPINLVEITRQGAVRLFL